MTDRDELAIESFSRAIELRPDEVRYCKYRADAYAFIGEEELAIADYTRAVALTARRRSLCLAWRAAAAPVAALPRVEGCLADRKACVIGMSCLRPLERKGHP